MRNDCPDTAQRSPAVRSAITNGTRVLDGVDGRSTSARRFRDLIVAFSDDMGGGELSEAERSTVRQAAAITLQQEAMQAAIVRGESIDTEQLTRLSNVAVRLLATLGRKQRNKSVDGPDLHTYIRKKDGAAA